MAYLGRPASAEVSVTGSTDTFTGDGNVAFTLSRVVTDNNPSLLEVFVSNVQQQPTVTFSVVNNVLTFTSAPGNGEPIYVTYRDYPVAPVFTIPDSSIVEQKIASLAVTEGKLAANAVTEAKIGTGAVTEGKLAANAVTEGKLAANAVTEAKIADSAVTPNKISGQVPVTKGGTGVASLTANAILLGNGTSAVATVSAGNTGNVLTSDGNAWISQAISTGGNYVMTVFTSPGTYTKPAGLKAVKVTVIGGGGGCGNNTPVVPGGTSSFGTFLSATGGTSVLAGNGAGGLGSGGQINISGSTGVGIGGGGSAFGYGAFGPGTGRSFGGGATGGDNGAGGGGGGAIEYLDAPAITGPVSVTIGAGGNLNPPANIAGAAGIVIIEEFY